MMVCASTVEPRRRPYVHSAVDAEELAGLVVQLFQVLSVPVEIRCEEQVRPQVYTVSIREWK